MIFVDTSAFIPLILQTDEFHNTASVWWQKHTGTSIVTSNLVVIETLGWIRHKAGKAIAVKAGMHLLFNTDIRREKILSPDEEEAWKIFQNKDGRGLSMIDCTSFALMKRLKITEAFTFDTDFADMGFTTYPNVD